MSATTGTHSPQLAEFGRRGGQLTLHFDVNKTIIATDIAGGRPDVSMVIQELLADKTISLWSPELSHPVSYSDFVKKHLYPGDKSDPEIRAARFKLLHNFVENQEQTPIYTRLKRDYDALCQKMSDRLLFPSFIHCLNTLEQLNIKATIVLRTFGHDLTAVTQAVERQLPKAKFVSGQMSKGKLLFEQHSYRSPSAIRSTLNSHRWVAIQDDWAWWIANKLHRHCGKPLFVDLKDSRTHAIFFDDNIKTDPSSKTNIVCAHNLKGEEITATCLESRQLISVDTLEAIRDPNYFLKQIESSLICKKD